MTTLDRWALDSAATVLACSAEDTMDAQQRAVAAFLERLAAPGHGQPQLAVSWDQVRSRVSVMAARLQQRYPAPEEQLTGLCPLPGGEVPAALLSGMTGVPLVEWVGADVAVVGLVARRCVQARHWVETLGEGLADVLYAFRAPRAPLALEDGHGASFTVLGQEWKDDPWLVMPWEAGARVMTVREPGDTGDAR
jgi:hypothetical protein